MGKKLIDNLRKDRDSAKSTIETMLEKVEGGTQLNEAEKKNLDDLTKTAIELDARIKELTELELADIAAKTLDNKLDSALAEFGSIQVSDRKQLSEPKITNLGKEFTESDIYRSYLQMPSGKSGLFTSEFALIDTVNGSIPGVDRVSDSPMPVNRTPFLNAISYEPVSTGSIDWISWPAAVPLAGVVAEGAVKPEATYAPVLNTAALDKLAHHVPVTREMLEDVPRARAIISGALLDGVRKKAENDAVGRVNSMTGAQAASGDDLLAAIRVGIAKVSDQGWNPTVVLMNPMDYALIDIGLLNVTVSGAVLGKSLWGLTVVTSGLVTAGTAFVLDRVAVTFFDRRVTNVYITDSHAEEFISNILRILAEARSRTEIVRPEAIAKCTVSAPVIGSATQGQRTAPQQQPTKTAKE